MAQEQLRVENTASARDGLRVLRCQGPLTMGTVSALQGAVRSENAATVIIDLSEVPYIDSAGLGSLVHAYIAYQKAGRRLALVGVNERASALLQMTNVEHLFPIFPSLGEAERGLA
jgi:anti-sigma B factor antagonist